MDRGGADRYRLIRAFEELFNRGPYRHRDSTLGNFVARHLYEDLYQVGYSPDFNRRVDSRECVVNVEGATRGVKARRGDGTFGAIVPHSKARCVPEFVVCTGPVAFTQIGIEVKILAKSQLKQIDRVITVLKAAVPEIRRKSDRAVAIGIAAVNFSASYTGYEGERAFPVDRAPERARQEAEEVSRRIEEQVRPAFDEFLLLRFEATNRPPFPFAWLNPRNAAEEYGAALVRVAVEYGRRF